MRWPWVSEKALFNRCNILRRGAPAYKLCCELDLKWSYRCYPTPMLLWCTKPQTCNVHATLRNAIQTPMVLLLQWETLTIVSMPFSCSCVNADMIAGGRAVCESNVIHPMYGTAIASGCARAKANACSLKIKPEIQLPTNGKINPRVEYATSQWHLLTTNHQCATIRWSIQQILFALPQCAICSKKRREGPSSL